ncbi:fimbria/pilus outer membrane usher protein [Paramixta manurensis]|uniref:Fimbria/pilus outer membrane usher protein n=1 Tax=Paramixta manurensis TaxID=2740817 RepID=A0A6M8UE57_9GAMM|nr:fimbria/pilus outer membrane usher protein [Erwiniaceae bacterium PD-1]
MLPRSLLLLLALLLLPFSLAQAQTQHVLVIVNNAWKGNISLDFQHDFPCLGRPLLEEWGVKLRHFAADAWSPQGCLSEIELQRHHIRLWYQPEGKLLTLLFPPGSMNPQQNGVSTSRWDDGINAAFVNYRVDYDWHRPEYAGDERGANLEVQLDNGLNYGPWRLRYQNTLWKDRQGQHGSYTRSASLWRAIRPLRSQLLFGDSTTSDTFFAGMPFRGVTLATDEAMFPDSWRPFSPWINGFAKTQAEVTIQQNGETVYRINVPPGPFTIRDFYPPNPDGSLQLTITESDGTEHERDLPYAAMPALVHEDNLSYELVGGRYRTWHGVDSATPGFFQATLARGIAPLFTLYGGVQHADSYLGSLAGVGVNLKAFGALSADVTRSDYISWQETFRGSMWRMRYAKAFFSTETSFSAMLRYYPAGQNYRSLEEKITQPAPGDTWLSDESQARKLSQELWLNQTLSENSSLSLSYAQHSWRSPDKHTRSFSLSYANSFDDIDISIWLERSRSQWGGPETTLAFTIGITLPDAIAGSSPAISYTNNLASHAAAKHGVNLYGTALSDYSLRYDITAEHTEHGNDALNASMGYQYNGGEMNSSLVRSGKQRDYHADVSGSLLLHAGGITPGQTMSDTMALLVVPDSPGIASYNQFGVTTNARGEALVGYLTPWRVNRLTLDSWNLPDGITLPVSELETVPTKGAIIKATFPPTEKAPGS